MSFIFQYILIAISAGLVVAISPPSQLSIDVQRCKERVITKCPCGQGGNLTDVYVDGCRVSSNESFPCQPCAGSCNLFFNCEKCSKHECISCPPGKTGPTCEPLPPDNGSRAEGNRTAIQNPEELVSSKNFTTGEGVKYGFDQSVPDMVILDISKVKNSSFSPTMEGNRPEIKLDMIEFNAGYPSFVHFMPNIASENDSTAINKTDLGAPQNETENQDLVGTAESNKDVLINNETDFENESDVTYSQKNDTINAPFEDRIPGHVITLIEALPQELPPVNDPVNASDGLQNDDEVLLANHRSPNPSTEDDNYKILRHVLKKSLNYERDQLELGDSHQQDLTGAYQQDYPENPMISAVQEDPNKAGSQNDSQPESNRKTTLGSKYVYISENDESESKYPDKEEESSSLEQEPISEEKLTESEETKVMKPDQQPDVSKPNLPKQYFDSKEEADLKSKIDPLAKDIQKIICKIFPIISACHQITTDDNEDFDSHGEHTFGSFLSPEASPNPGSKLLFPNTENNAPSTNFEMDTVEQNNNGYSETQKIGFSENVEKELARLDAIQQKNDQYFESHGNVHKPIPKNLGVSDPSLSNPLPSIFIGQRYARNLAPPSPKSDMIPEPPNSPIFDQSRVPNPFDLFLGSVGYHITPFEEDRPRSGENRSHRSQKVRPETKNILKPTLSFPFNPASSVANNHVGIVNLMTGSDKNYFSLEYQKTPVVEKGLMLFAKFELENGTAPRIVPGSERGKMFEFEMPMAISSLYADSKESKNPTKAEHSKHGKGSRRFRKLHNKRRRNGVKNDSGKCDPWMEDCSTFHETHISKKTKHDMSSKASKKDRSKQGYVRIRYVKEDQEPMYDSVEISESFVPNKNAFYQQAPEYDLENFGKAMENFTTDYETEQASFESNADSESIGHHFRSRRDVQDTPFCPIPRDSRNGDLDCTIWSYKKTCTLVCHNGYSSPSQYFTCQRSKNTWVPPMVSCRGGPEYEPVDESRIQMKSLDDNLEDEVEEPPSRNNNNNKEDDYDEKSSGEMGDRDKDEGKGEELPTPLPVKTHAHKKEGNLKKYEYDEKSSGEMGVPYQIGEEEGAAAMTSDEPVKKKTHPNSFEETQNVQKDHAKGEPPQEVQEEPVGEASKEETAPKTGSGEEQSGEEASTEQVDESPKDQDVQEVGENDVDEADYERRK